MDWLYAFGIFIGGVLTGFAWRNSNSSQDQIKERLRRRILELEEKQIEREMQDEAEEQLANISEQEQIELLESWLRKDWRRIQ